MPGPTAVSELTERELERQVVDLARALGWRRYHTYRSKRSEAGWPDEALVRDRLVLLELKSATGRLSPAQKEWLRALVAADVECYLIRPDDLDDLAAVLVFRGYWAEDRGARIARDRLRDRLKAALEIPHAIG